MRAATSQGLRRVLAAVVGTIALGALITWAVRPKPLEVRVATVERGRFELSIDEEGLTRVTDRFVVSAPIAGQVSRARLQVGDPVDAGQWVAEIVAQPPAMLDWRTLTGLRERAAAAATAVNAALAARDRAAAGLLIARVKLKRNLELARDGFISDAALEANELGVEERPVKVILDPEPDPITQSGDGWRVNASIITLSEDDVLIVPNGALLRRGETWMVLVVEGGRSQAQPVNVAARNARTAWIREGLSAGQSVIQYPRAALPDRTRVTGLKPGG